MIRTYMNNIESIYELIDRQIEKEYQSIKSPGLLYGRMGIALYLYNRKVAGKKDDKLENLADKLIDDVYSSVTRYSSLNIEHGLIGIALGLLFLMEKGYVEGDPSEILSDLDDKIFHELSFNDSVWNDSNIETLLAVGHYIIQRLNYCDPDEDFSILFKELLIRIINHFSQRLSGNIFLFKEPGCFSVRWILPNYLSFLGE